MKKNFSTLFAFFCFVLLVSVLCVSASEGVSSASLYSQVLRLHVIANSDTASDQELKYKVRDGILCVTRELFSGCESVEEALKIAEDNKALLEAAARDVLRQNDSGRDAAVLVGRETYPEKEYGGITFPEGEYLSVRVVIGDGKGKNWWCVLFPPLCNVGVEDGYVIDKEEAEKLKSKTQKGVEFADCRITLKIFDLFDRGR